MPQLSAQPPGAEDPQTFTTSDLSVGAIELLVGIPGKEFWD